MRNRIVICLAAATASGAAVVVVFQVFNDPSQRTAYIEWSAIASAVVATLTLIGGLAWARSDSRRERAALGQGLLVPIHRVGAVDADKIGVAETIYPKLARTYLPRAPADNRLHAAIGQSLSAGSKWIVAVIGPAVVGKTRTLFEALRRHDANDGQLLLVAPKNMQSLRVILSEDLKLKKAAVLWLDHFDRFLADGLTEDDLLNWRDGNANRMVAITFGNIAGASSFPYFQKYMQIVELQATTRGALQRIRATLAPADFEDACDHGWAAFLSAGTQIAIKLATGRHAGDTSDCPEGLAVVRAIVDRARCGRTDGIVDEELRGIWTHYLPPGLPPSKSVFERGLDWALRPVAGTVALVTFSGAYRPNGYALRLCENKERQRPRDGAWTSSLSTASDLQCLNVSLSAANYGLWHYAIEGSQRVALSSDDGVTDFHRCLAYLICGPSQLQLQNLPGVVEASDAIISLARGRPGDLFKTFEVAALLQKADVFGLLDQSGDAISTYQDAIDSALESEPTLLMRDMVIAAFARKGHKIHELVELGSTHLTGDAIEAYQKAVAAFEQPVPDWYKPSDRARRDAADSLFGLAVLTNAVASNHSDPLPSWAKARDIYVQLYRTFSNDANPETAKRAQNGFMNAVYQMIKIDDRSEAMFALASEIITMCDNRIMVFELLRNNPHADIDYYHFASAMNAKAAIMGFFGASSHLLHAAFGRVVETFEGYSGDEALQIFRLVNHARLTDGDVCVMDGNVDRARTCYEKVISDCHGSSDPTLKRALTAASDRLSRLGESM